MREIPLTQGKKAQVDDEDYSWLMKCKWYYDEETGYARRQGDDALMHEVIMGVVRTNHWRQN